MKQWIKNLWLKWITPNCAYCTKPAYIWYEAYLFPEIKEYKGVIICETCVKTLENASKN